MSDTMTNRVTHGDFRDILPGLPDESFDLVFLDPPYFMQFTDKKMKRWGDGDSHLDGQTPEWDRFASQEAYNGFIVSALEQSQRLLRPAGCLWVSGTYQCIHRIGAIMADLGYWFLGDVTWFKRNAIPNFRGARLALNVETLIWAAKGRKEAALAKRRYHKQAAKQFSRDDWGAGHAMSVWSIPVCRGRERVKDEAGKTLHPTQKPIELLRRVITMTTSQGHRVLDPMCGTGTTAAAARQLRRDFVAIDADARYARHAQARLDAISPLDIVAPE